MNQSTPKNSSITEYRHWYITTEKNTEESNEDSDQAKSSFMMIKYRKSQFQHETKVHLFDRTKDGRWREELSGSWRRPGSELRGKWYYTPAVPNPGTDSCRRSYYRTDHLRIELKRNGIAKKLRKCRRGINWGFGEKRLTKLWNLAQFFIPPTFNFIWAYDFNFFYLGLSNERFFVSPESIQRRFYFRLYFDLMKIPGPRPKIINVRIKYRLNYTNTLQICLNYKLKKCLPYFPAPRGMSLSYNYSVIIIIE